MYTGQVERNFLLDYIEYIYIYTFQLVEKCSPLDSEQILTEAEKLQLQVFRSFDERNRPDFLSFENYPQNRERETGEIISSNL